MKTTVKNVGLAPVNRKEAQKFTAMQSPAYREEFWNRMEEINDTDNYMYMLKEADAKGITADSFNFEGFEGNLDDEWAEFYREVAADSNTLTDYGEGYGEMTEKDYLGKLLDQKKEYNAWIREEEKIQVTKEAMSGWDKFWAGTGHFFVNIGYSIEGGAMALADFVSNWDGGGVEETDWIRPWKENQEARKEQLADWERRYSYRDVKTGDTGFGATMLLGSAHTLGLMIPAAIANKIAPGAGMYTMYGSVFAQNVFEARNDPNVTASEGEIILRAALQTGVEVAVELALGASMLDDVILHAGRGSKEMVKVTTKSGVKLFAKEILREASEEFLQELGSSMVNMVLSLDNDTWLQHNSENLAADLGMAALLGGIFAGGRIVIPEIVMAPVRGVRTLTGNIKPGEVIADVPKVGKDGKVKTPEGSNVDLGDYNTFIDNYGHIKLPSGNRLALVKDIDAEISKVKEVAKTREKAHKEEKQYTKEQMESSAEYDAELIEYLETLRGFKGKQTYHQMNMFERLAMQINLKTFFQEVKDAQAGKMSAEQRRTIYNQAMLLGQIFQGMDGGQLTASMKLLALAESYAKRQSAKQEKIVERDAAYLQGIVTQVVTLQKDAVIKLYGQKIDAKEAAKLAKEARISKINRVITPENVAEAVTTVEEAGKGKDTKPKARKKVIEATAKEGKKILTNDGEKVEVIEDNVLIPDRYLEEGNPATMLSDVVEKDLAQEFVVYMKSPKRLTGWAQAKAALIKAFPEMGSQTKTIRKATYDLLAPEVQAEYKPSKTGKTYRKTTEGYTDQQIARNILFNKGGAYALVSNLTNSEFNLLFLNSIEGIRQVVYKSGEYTAAKQKTLELVEGNFRYAARMYAIDNMGINPHELHNVLTKEDQMFIKNERAKAEAKFNEVARAANQQGAKQALVEDIDMSTSPEGKTHRQFLEIAKEKFGSIEINVEENFGFLSEEVETTLEFLEKGSFEVYEKVIEFLDFFEDAPFKEDFRKILKAMSEHKPFPEHIFDVLLMEFAEQKGNTLTGQKLREALVERKGAYDDLMKSVWILNKPLFVLAMIEYLYTPVFTGDGSGRLGSPHLLTTLNQMIEATPWVFKEAPSVIAYRGVKVKRNSPEASTEFIKKLRQYKPGDVFNFDDEGRVMPISMDAPYASRFSGEKYLAPNETGGIETVRGDGVLLSFVFEKQPGIMTPVGKGEGELLVKGGLSYEILAVNPEKTQYLLKANYDTNSKNEIAKPEPDNITAGKMDGGGFLTEVDKKRFIDISNLLDEKMPLIQDWYEGKEEVEEPSAAFKKRVLKAITPEIKELMLEALWLFEGKPQGLSLESFLDTPLPFLRISGEKVKPTNFGSAIPTSGDVRKDIDAQDMVSWIGGVFSSEDSETGYRVYLYEGLIKPKDLLGFLPTYEREMLVPPSYFETAKITKAHLEEDLDPNPRSEFKTVYDEVLQEGSSDPKVEPIQEYREADTDLEDAGFTTPEYEGESYKLFRAMLRTSLSTMEKGNVLLKDVIKDPESYLKQEIVDMIKDDYGDTSPNSTYRFLRMFFIDETKGVKTIVRSENGDRYFFADVTPIKKWNTPSITKIAKTDPKGRSLFEKYKAGTKVNAKTFWRGEALVGNAANVEVEFREGGGTHYSSDQNKIFFDLTQDIIPDNQAFLFTLNHEFQHALQATNRTASGFALNLKLPKVLVDAVKAEYPKEFNKKMTALQEMKRANQVIYKYSGEMEANLHAIDDDFGQFIIAVKGENYVVFTPEGQGPFEFKFEQLNKLDSDKDKDTHELTSHKKRSRKVPKYKAKESNLKYLLETGKPLRAHPALQDFIINAKNLNLLEDDVADMITSGDLKNKGYQKMLKWFKNAKSINAYTFKHMQEAFWPDSPIKSFEELVKITTTLTMETDEQGNPIEKEFVEVLDKKGKFLETKYPEVKFKFEGQEFTISEDLYRTTVMEYWTQPSDLNTIRKIVGSTEILRRTITFSALEGKAKKGSKDGGEGLQIEEVIGGMTEDLVDALFDTTERAQREKALRRAAIKKITSRSLAGKMTQEQARVALKKYSKEYFEKMPNDELDKMYVKEFMRKENLKVQDVTIEKAITRNRKNAVKNIKRMGTVTWNNTTNKNRVRMLTDIKSLFKDAEDIDALFTKEGKIKPELYKGRSQVEIVNLENLLRKISRKARRGEYNSKEVEKAYAEVEKSKKQVERLKNKAKTQVHNSAKVVVEYVTKVKTEAKVIEVKTTKKKTPAKLEQLLSTGFNKKRMSQMQEMENFEYHVAEKEVFREQNKDLLDSITEAEWIDIVEWFEQSDFIGTEGDLGTFKALRMYILADLVSRIKTHNIVMNKTWVNRVNNLITKNVHSSAVELGTWSRVLNMVNPYRQLAQEFNLSEEALEDVQMALESDDDVALAKAIDEIKKEIADSYVEKTLIEKLYAFRYNAMLSGPMTWFRNLVSNYVVKYFHKWSAGLGEKMVGKRMAKYKGYTLVGTKVTKDIAEFIQLNLLDTGLLHQLNEGYSKYDPYSAETAKKVDKDYIIRTMINNFNKQFEQDHLYGSGKLSPLFTKFSTFVRKMISDEKFVSEATVRYFGKMLTEDIAEGRLDKKVLEQGMFTKEIVSRFAEAQWLAMGDYMKNANFMTKAMSALNENKYARYIMPLIIPFAQSSWNWWVETMKYSPLGLAVAIKRLANFDKYIADMETKRASSKKGQSASVQSSMMDKYIATRDLGKGVIGTFLFTTGVMLAATGVIGIGRGKDDQYVIKLFDGKTEINVDPWFGSSTLMAGAAVVSVLKDGNWEGVLGATLDQMAKTLFITDLLSSFSWGSTGDYIMGLPMDILYSFVPNFIKQLSTNIQVHKVKYDKGLLGDLERFATGLVPGLSYAFPAEVDPFTGKKRLHRIPILTQFGGISYQDISKAEREAHARGLGAQQLKGEITVNGEKVQLDADKLNIYRGEYNNLFLNALIEDEVSYKGKRYSSMTREEQTTALRSAMNKANSYAKIKLWTEMGNKYYAGADLYLALKSLDIQRVYRGSGGYIKG